MRIAFISHSARAADAIGNQLAEKVRFFLERGAEVRLFVESVERLQPDLAHHCQLVARVQTQGPVWEYLTGADLVFADYPHWYELLHFLPLLVGKRPRIVVEYHGVTPPHLWSGARLEQGSDQRGVIWCADAVLVHSRFTRKELTEAIDYREERIVQLPCVLGEPAPTPGACDLRRQWGLENRKVLLFVGRLAANKRVPVLVEALSQLRDEQPEVHAVLVGDRGDVYGVEAERCVRLAAELGVGSRLHVLGQVSEVELWRVYRSADVLVIPSLHEGFCVPVAEAMACGLPVVAARAGALPESVGPAGVTFRPDDAEDLARQVRRVLGVPVACGSPLNGKRIAVVAFRFGADVVGGAETSLRTIAETLLHGGHEVEIYTTCTRGESVWKNELPAGTRREGDLVIHRFPIDPHDRERHLASVRAILDGSEPPSADLERDYLQHSIHSSALVEALRERADSIDAIVTGPYLFGLTRDVARAFADKTLLLPCFHDERLARLATWCEDYGSVGGILYHTPEEQEFAQAELGINHPHATQIGTWLDMTMAPGPRTSARRYIVYCGRYSAEKNVPLLVDFMRTYQRQRPGRFACHFLGRGEVAIPREEGFVDLGWVLEGRKREVLAGAAALVQLSVNESLSLVALEAWAQGTPVIAHRDSAVMVGQIARATGGEAIADYAGFARVLDDLWENSDTWRRRGQEGRAYVRKTYGCRETLATRLQRALDGLRVPLREHMRERGRQWAQRCRRDVWRQGFGAFVEQVLDAGAQIVSERVEIQPHRACQSVAAGMRSFLLTVRLANLGNQVATADGPGRTILCSEVIDEATGQAATPPSTTVLPGPLVPRSMHAAIMAVNLPETTGTFLVRLWAERGPDGVEVPGSPASMELLVRPDLEGVPQMAPIVEDASRALAEAYRLQTLPDDYIDVTEGLFARAKKWVKRKLLGNFKLAYVDVLSRQQSKVNKDVLTALQNLTEHCMALDHAVRGLQDKVDRLPSSGEPKETEPRGDTSSPGAAPRVITGG